MKLALVCLVGPLDRFGYQHTYPIALESYSLFADKIYLISSTRNNVHVEEVRKRFPKAVYIANDQTRYGLDEVGEEVFDIYQWDRNVELGLGYADQEGMDAAVVLPINAYIPETAMPLIHSKIERMLAEERPFEYVYRRVQFDSRLFVTDEAFPNVINLRMAQRYRIKNSWTESPAGEKIPILFDGYYQEATREAFVDCPLEMTIDDFRNKLNFTRCYSQLNPDVPSQFDFDIHVKRYYLPKFYKKTITRDPLDRFGRMIAANSRPDFISHYVLRQYLNPWRRIKKSMPSVKTKLFHVILPIKAEIKKLRKNRHLLSLRYLIFRNAVLMRYYLKNAILHTPFRYGYYRTLSSFKDKTYNFELDKHPVRKKHHGKGGWKQQFDGDFRYRDYASYDEYVMHQIQKLVEIMKVGGFSNHDILTYRRTFFRRFRGLLGILSKSAHIVCLGARQGTEVEVLRDLGFKNAFGIDLNPGPDNPLVKKGDFMALEFADHSIDMVYSNCLDHAFDLDKFFEEHARVLKPNGLAIYDIAVQSETGGGPFESVEWKSEEALFLKALRHFRRVLKVETDVQWKSLVLQK